MPASNPRKIAGRFERMNASLTLAGVPLAVFNTRSPNVLSYGQHMGFDYQVRANPCGFRCGYVRLPPGHPWYEIASQTRVIEMPTRDLESLNYDGIDCSVHGGLTYAANEPDGLWIVFDCAHHGDAPDPSLPTYNEAMSYMGGEIRSTEYVENECRDLCKQAWRATWRAAGLPLDETKE